MLSNFVDLSKENSSAHTNLNLAPMLEISQAVILFTPVLEWSTGE